jgi:hypothetical protein
MAQRERNARPGLSGGTPAHRIDDNHHGRALLIAWLTELAPEYRIDLAGSAQLAHAEAGEFLTHWGNKEFRVGHKP